jgi:hypothetical protein
MTAKLLKRPAFVEEILRPTSLVFDRPKELLHPHPPGESHLYLF